MVVTGKVDVVDVVVVTVEVLGVNVVVVTVEMGVEVEVSV